MCSTNTEVVSHSTRKKTDEQENLLNVFSLNVKNIKSNYLYIDKLANNKQKNIFFLQETWLKTCEKIRKNVDINAADYTIKEKSHDQPDIGRTPGGVAWMVAKSVSRKPVIVFHNHRISHCVIEDLVIIGVYMAYNDNKMETQAENEENVGIINSVMEKYEQAKIMILGDWNMDIYRKTKHDKILTKLSKNAGMINISKLFTQSVDHSYQLREKKSLIDHVLVNMSMAKSIHQCNITRDSTNSSDHHVVHTTISGIEGSSAAEVVACSNRNSCLKIDWTDEEKKFEYGIETWRKLRKIVLPVIREGDSHEYVKQTAERITSEVNIALKEAVREVAGVSAEKVYCEHSKSNSWWSEELDELRRNKNYWRDRSTEKHWWFNKEFRRVQRRRMQEKEDKNYKYIANLYYMDKKMFWKKLKENSRSDEKVEIGIDDLVNQFKDLFNTEVQQEGEASGKWTNAESIVQSEMVKIEMRSERSEVEVDQAMIERIVNNLQCNKAIGINGVSNEMYRFSGYGKLVSILKYLMNIVLGRAIMPDEFNVGKILPILKDANKSSSDMKNIRPITIADVLANVYEKMVQRKILEKYEPNALQFGFKANSSCQHALFTVQELIRLSAKRGETTYVCALDASKAFDKVNRNILMAKLRDKMDDATWKSFYEYYKESKAFVSNEGKSSGQFRTSVGVKQGGPSSPLLFSIYSEELIERIKRTGCGIHMGNLVIGIVCFADDVLLITNRWDEMQRMLRECEEYGIETQIKWNPTKTVFCRFGRGNKKEVEKLVFCGEELEEEESFRYLGVIMSKDFKCAKHIMSRIGKSSYAVHKLMESGAKSKVMDIYLKVFLYKTFVRPVLMYGMSTAYLRAKEVKVVQKSEAKMLKKIAGIRRRTKNTGLLHALEVENVRSKLDLEKCKLFIQLYNNDMTRQVLDFVASDEKLAETGGKWTTFVSEVVEICSRVRRENMEAAIEKRTEEESMFVLGEVTIGGRMESTMCMANQSRFIPRVEMLLMEAQTTIELLAAKKKKEFGGGVPETIRFLLSQSENKMRNKEIVEQLLKAFDRKPKEDT